MFILIITLTLIYDINNINININHEFDIKNDPLKSICLSKHVKISRN